YRELSPGEHIGYRKLDRGRAGTWVHRWAIGNNKYREEGIGTGDDILDAPDSQVLSWHQAQERIRERIKDRVNLNGESKIDPYRLRCNQAWDYHVTASQSEGKVVGGIRNEKGRIVRGRDDSTMWPELWDIPVMSPNLATKIRSWMTKEAKSPKRVRTRGSR